MVCVCEVESVCVCCLQGQGHREVGGGVRMSGGICVCVCEENHHSSHQCARIASIFAIAARSSSLLLRGREWSPVARGERPSWERSFDSVPGGLPEQQHQSEKQFLPLLHLSPFLHRPSTELDSCHRCQPFKTGWAIFDISRALLSTKTCTTRGNGEW